jgi:hypothetical protein
MGFKTIKPGAFKLTSLLVNPCSAGHFSASKKIGVAF